jgi:tripartite-type tricarboxylate transporter receptor subunit TctC
VGIPEIEGISNWFGLVGPKGLPTGILASYKSAVDKVTTDAEYIAKLNDNGIVAATTPSEDFSKRIARETELFRRVVAAASITAE